MLCLRDKGSNSWKLGCLWWKEWQGMPHVFKPPLVVLIDNFCSSKTKQWFHSRQVSWLREKDDRFCQKNLSPVFTAISKKDNITLPWFWSKKKGVIVIKLCSACTSVESELDRWEGISNINHTRGLILVIAFTQLLKTAFLNWHSKCLKISNAPKFNAYVYNI